MTEEDYIGAFFTLLPGVLLVGYAGYYLLLGVWSYFWPHVACSISTLSHMQIIHPKHQGIGGHSSYRIHGKYSYDFKGQTYTSDKVGIKIIDFSNISDAKMFIQEICETQRARICPLYPQLACLSPGPTRGSIVGIIFGGVLILVFITIINS